MKWRNLISKVLTLWYDDNDREQRDSKTERVHERASQAIEDADRLISSYRELDRTLLKHQRIWKSYVDD